MSKSPIPIVSLQIAGVCGALENLADRGYDTLEKVAATADAELRRTRGVGPLTLEKIKLAAASHGIPWTGKPYIPNLRGPIIKFDQTNASMQLRDWFAGQVLSSDWIADYSMIEGAELAYKYADALLAARAKEQP